MEITKLFDFIHYQLEHFPREDAFAMKRFGKWEKTSTLQFVNQANKISRGLLKMGIKPKDKVALIATNNRTEWNIMDIGLQQIGAISVPVYPTISAKDYEFIFNDADIKFCFVSDEELYKKVQIAKDAVPSLVGVYTFDDVPGAASWQEIMGLGEDNSTQHEVEHMKSLVKSEDLVTIIYTSGTTGQPKGVMLTHENIVSDVLGSKPRVPEFSKDPIALSFLPVCHIFERMLCYLYQYGGIGIYFAESIETIGDNMKEVHPNVMSVVPRLVEKVYGKIYDKGRNAGGIKTKLFMWALGLVEEYDPYADHSFWFKIQHKVASALVFKKWREGVGGNLECMVSGSAALSGRLNRIFWGAGIPILEGYGLTETSPVISVNAMHKGGFQVGSVGKPIDTVEVKIADDGEILVKGRSVFKGYYNNPEKTKEVFTDDGFFMTGDIGEFTPGGLLRITDRKKEIFKTSGGKYIAPQIIENDFKQSRFIEQIMVVGEGEKMPCALIQPSFEFLESYIKEKNLKDLTDKNKIVNSEIIIERIQQEVNEMNQKLGHWEQIKGFRLTADEWTIDEGHLTPTMKLKRKVVMQKYRDLYKELYGERV